MLRVGLMLAVFVAVVLTAERASDAPPTSCYVQVLVPVHFRNATANDVLELTIGAKTCMGAVPTVVVRSDDGRMLYWFVPANDGVYPGYIGKPLDKGTSEKLIHYEADRAMETTANLESYEDGNQDVKISKQAYEKLRTMPPRPMLMHTHAGDGANGRAVIYDEDLQKAVVVFDWWL